MTTITIPTRIARKRSLIAVPKEEYEVFSRWKKAVGVHLEDAWFWTPEWQKREAEAEEAIRAGKVAGPFLSYKSLISALKKKRK